MGLITVDASMKGRTRMVQVPRSVVEALEYAFRCLTRRLAET